MSRKLLSILSLLVISSMVLAACGAAQEPETIVETEDASPVPVEKLLTGLAWSTP